MGNVVQCGIPNIPVEEDDDISELSQLTTGRKSLSNATCFPANKRPKQGHGFLEVHLEDRQGKWILEQDQVDKSIVKQAEEFIIRDLLSNELSINSSFSGDSDDEELMPPLDDAVSTIYATSEMSASVSPSDMATSIFTADTGILTTDTAKTRTVYNFAKNRKNLRSKRRTAGPPQMLGTEFNPMDTLLEDLETVLEDVSREEERKRMAVKLSRAIDTKGGCLLPFNMILARPMKSENERRVRQYMSVLHLRMIPRCAEYFRKHLSRQLSDNAFARAFYKSISDTDLCPKRGYENCGTPQLAHSRSDSSMSTTSEIEFEEGPPSSPVQLLVTGSPFLDLAVTGSLGLGIFGNGRRKYAARSETPGRKLVLPPEQFIVLLNRRSGAPLAVCALKAPSNGPPVVRVYSTKRRVFSQRPSATTRQLGLEWTESFPLYAWAEIVTEGCFPECLTYSIYMALGNDGRFEEEPSYRARQTHFGSPEIRMVGRTEREQTYTGCAVLCLSRDEDALDDEELFFRLSISKGIDPALLICFAAFVDEATERTMMKCMSPTRTNSPTKQ